VVGRKQQLGASLFVPIPSYQWGDKMKMSWAEHAANMGEIRKSINILIENTEEKKLLCRHRSKWGIVAKWCSKKNGREVVE
jgi:hypothetical protein